MIAVPKGEYTNCRIATAFLTNIHRRAPGKRWLQLCVYACVNSGQHPFLGSSIHGKQFLVLQPLESIYIPGEKRRPRDYFAMDHQVLFAQMGRGRIQYATTVGLSMRLCVQVYLAYVEGTTNAFAKAEFPGGHRGASSKRPKFAGGGAAEGIVGSRKWNSPVNSWRLFLSRIKEKGKMTTNGTNSRRRSQISEVSPREGPPQPAAPNKKARRQRGGAGSNWAWDGTSPATCESLEEKVVRATRPTNERKTT